MPERGSVLVVDDDDDLRATLRELLAEEGYAVYEAENGAQALDRLRDARRVAVVLLDLMMPVMDGLQFRRAQRQDAAIATIPVVLMTASQLTEQVNQVEADASLQKPVTLDQLLATVSRFAGVERGAER